VSKKLSDEVREASALDAADSIGAHSEQLAEWADRIASLEAESVADLVEAGVSLDFHPIAGLRVAMPGQKEWWVPESDALGPALDEVRSALAELRDKIATKEIDGE